VPAPGAGDAGRAFDKTKPAFAETILGNLIVED
jgi:hypothetical protein